MKYCLYYWLFEPLTRKLIDHTGRESAFSVPVTHLGTDYEFSLFCNDEEIPEFVRLKIPKLEKEEIPDSVLPLMQALKEHMLSILRLGYSEDIQLFHKSVWAFFEEGEPYNMNLEFSMQNHSGKLNKEGIRNFFSSSLPFREEIRLFIEGNNFYMPLQYRFLSYYKILEHEFKKTGHWQKNFDQFLSKYKASFEALGFEGKPASCLHKLRDKCAHVKTGSKKEVMGISPFNHKEAVLVENVLPLLKEIVMDVLNTKVNGAFFIGSSSEVIKEYLKSQ